MTVLHRISLRVVPHLSRVLAATWRYREVGDDGDLAPPTTRAGPFIYVTWHERLVPLMLRYAGEGMTLLVGPHPDADLAVAIVEALGSRAVRGAPGAHGSQALLELVHAVRRGNPVGLVPDGPLGPPRICKRGVVELAAQTGQKVVPVSASARPAVHLPRWDHLLVPLPFALVVTGFGPPLGVPPEADRSPEEMAVWQERVARALDAVGARCDAAVRKLTHG